MRRWPRVMALRKRRSTPAGSPRPSLHPHANLYSRSAHFLACCCCCPVRPSSSNVKCVLLVTAAAVLLLVFAVGQRREAAASCRLCLLGEGEVREYRHGDGGLVQHVGNHGDGSEEGEEGEWDVDGEAAVSAHPQIFPRLFHEKQSTPVGLMHALNNLMQGKRRITREEMDYIAQKHVSSKTSFHNDRDDIENFDTEVIQALAASRGKTVYFIDSVERLDREIDLLDLRDHRLVGFLLHLKRRLWIAVRNCHGLWYDFDSTKAAPLLFCDGAPSVHMFLQKVVDDGGLIVALRKPRPANPIIMAEGLPPPPSWTDMEYWKFWLYG